MWSTVLSLPLQLAFPAICRSISIQKGRQDNQPNGTCYSVVTLKESVTGIVEMTIQGIGPSAIN